MDTYFEEGAEPPRPRPREDIPAFPFPIEPIDISLARFQVASRIGQLPFDGYEASTRSLWLVFAGDWGVWVRAVIPVDNRLDAEDRATLAAKCAEAADLLGEPECYGIAIAAVVLRRPAPDKPSRADRQIFRLRTRRPRPGTRSRGRSSSPAPTAPCPSSRNRVGSVTVWCAYRHVASRKSVASMRCRPSREIRL
jgi:hypothetical protein